MIITRESIDVTPVGATHREFIPGKMTVMLQAGHVYSTEEVTQMANSVRSAPGVEFIIVERKIEVRRESPPAQP